MAVTGRRRSRFPPDAGLDGQDDIGGGFDDRHAALQFVERLGLRRDTRRLPIFGLGCAGGVTGLARAVDQARVLPGSHVLYLVVELCTLTFRHGDNSKSNVVASALFGDGAAAAIISTEGPGPAFGPAGEHTVFGRSG